MDILSTVISLVSGAVGGNVAGAASPDNSLGGVGNTIVGLVGGGLGGSIIPGRNARSSDGSVTGNDHLRPCGGEWLLLRCGEAIKRRSTGRFQNDRAT